MGVQERILLEWYRQFFTGATISLVGHVQSTSPLHCFPGPFPLWSPATATGQAFIIFHLDFCFHLKCDPRFLSLNLLIHPWLSYV